jgi:hypothetical protein
LHWSPRRAHLVQGALYNPSLRTTRTMDSAIFLPSLRFEALLIISLLPGARVQFMFRAVGRVRDMQCNPCHWLHHPTMALCLHLFMRRRARYHTTHSSPSASPKHASCQVVSDSIKDEPLAARLRRGPIWGLWMQQWIEQRGWHNVVKSPACVGTRE